MNSEEAYEVWAPRGGPWSPWVKPILFANERNWDDMGDPELPALDLPSWLAPPETPRPPEGYRDAGRAKASPPSKRAYVLDLPGAAAIEWGMALARQGWWPVPLYAAVPGGSLAQEAPPPVAPFPTPYGEEEMQYLMPRDTTALVDVYAIVAAMRKATSMLAQLKGSASGPPVFLLDASRRYGLGVPSPGRFDNRSVSLPTDFPSAVFLKAHGVDEVVLVQLTATDPQEDLAHTLLGWQQGGIAILSKAISTETPPATLEVTAPSWFRSMFHRAMATMGLRRNPLGGFGGVIPIPSAG